MLLIHLCQTINFNPMKKMRTFISIVILGFVLLSSNSCKKATDPFTNPQDCDDLINAYSAAINAYVVDQTEANCEAYVDALSNLVNNCDILSAQDKQQYNEELANMDCSQ